VGGLAAGGIGKIRDGDRQRCQPLDWASFAE
jgi:hypothetical protein